nr:hypothetical protein [Tanacetum cinerariifolium]
MNPQETQQVVARDEKWVPSTERVKISSINVRLETIVSQKEETFQVVIDIIKNSTCFKAFTISRDVFEIFMQQFWYTIKRVKESKSYEFLLSNNKCIVDAEVFRKILEICPRVEGKEFTPVQDDDDTLTFLTDLGYKGNGSQGKKTTDTLVADVDVSEESELEPTKKRIAGRRVVKKKVTISADDNIIPDPDAALELGKYISITEAEREEAARSSRSVVIQDTLSAPKPKLASLKPKLKGVQSLTHEEQKATDVMQALKESKKPSRRQPGTGGSSEGTGRIPRVLNESTAVSATSSEGTGTKPGVLDEEKVSTEEKEDDEKKDDTDDDKSIDLEMTNDKETNDEVLKGKEQLNDEEDEEMTNAKVKEYGDSDEEDTNAAKAYAEKIKEEKDDSKKAKLPPTISSLSISLGFGDQFFKLSSDTYLIGTVKDTTDAEIRSLFDIKIQYEVTHIQSLFVLKVLVSVISEPTVLTPVQETPSAEPVTTLPPPSISTIPPTPLQQTISPIHSPPIITDAPTITTDDHKRKHGDDDDEDPSDRPKQGNKTKRKKTKDSESSKKPSTTNNTPKGKASSKGSKTSKFASAKEPVEEPIAEVVMNDAGEDVVRHPGHLTVAADYFFNNDLKYLKSFDLKRTYTTSITRTKAARSQMTKISKHNVYSSQKILGVKSVSVKKLHGYGHLEEVAVKRVDRQLWKFKEGNFVDLHLKKIKDMLLLAVQHKLFHLNKSNIVEFIMALCMFTRSLIIKHRVEDLQLGVESYRKKLNITAPQQTFSEIEFKELYTPSYKPPGVIYKDLAKQKRVMRADELYKILDGTLKKVRDKLHYRILNFHLGYNDEMSRRKWTAIDKKRSELIVELIDKQMRERQIIKNLE